MLMLEGKWKLYGGKTRGGTGGQKDVRTGTNRLHVDTVNLCCSEADGATGLYSKCAFTIYRALCRKPHKSIDRLRVQTALESFTNATGQTEESLNGRRKAVSCFQSRASEFYDQVLVIFRRNAAYVLESIFMENKHKMGMLKDKKIEKNEDARRRVDEGEAEKSEGDVSPR